MIALLIWLVILGVYSIPGWYVGGYTFKHYANKVIASMPTNQTMTPAELSDGHVYAVAAALLWPIAIFFVTFSKPLVKLASAGAAKADRDDVDLMFQISQTPELMQAHEELVELSRANGVEVKGRYYVPPKTYKV